MTFSLLISLILTFSYFIFILLFVSFVGLFNISHPPANDIVEVSLFGSGTGSGSGGGSGNASVAVMPRIVRKVDPTYPAAERNAGITGSGVVRLLVNTDGTVDEVTLVSSSGNANLDQAGINAAYKWRFTSAIGTNGQKVRCYLRLPFTFKLK